MKNFKENKRRRSFHHHLPSTQVVKNKNCHKGIFMTILISFAFACAIKVSIPSQTPKEKLKKTIQFHYHNISIRSPETPNHHHKPHTKENPESPIILQKPNATPSGSIDQSIGWEKKGKTLCIKRFPSNWSPQMPVEPSSPPKT